ncbi:MAG: LysR family transcriptional regulator [Myxococcota bacterium]
MHWPNFHHLLYFWSVARNGTIALASEELGVSQPTISTQIRLLEKELGEALFSRSGRRLVLTDAGRIVFEYSEEIFSLGREMVDTLAGRPSGKPTRLRVGISDALPKMLVHHLLEPLLVQPIPTILVCREGPTDSLLAELSVQNFDLVLADEPIASSVRVKAFNHLLGTCEALVVGTANLASEYRSNFPRSLSGAPFLMPAENTVLRRSLDRWLSDLSIRVNIIAEFDDSALMKQFGRGGTGLFVIPSILEADIVREYDVAAVGIAANVQERFFAITVDRRIKHPGVQVIVHSARAEMFARRA